MSCAHLHLEFTILTFLTSIICILKIILLINYPVIIFAILVNNDTQLMNRCIWMTAGLHNYTNTMIKIKTKSCGNGKIMYKVNQLNACYLNYCSKIVDHGKMLTWKMY